MRNKQIEERMKNLEHNYAWAEPGQRKWILIKELFIALYFLFEKIAVILSFIVGTVFFARSSVDFIKAGHLYFGVLLLCLSLASIAWATSYKFGNDEDDEEEAE